MSAETIFARDAPRFVESRSGRIAKFPRSAPMRWTVRVLLALPYAAVAVWFHVASGGAWTGTANAELAERVAGIAWGAPTVDVVASLYPPITSALALIVPGGPLGLALVGSAVAGLTLQLIVQSLQRKHFPRPVRIVFLVTLAASPAFAYIVVTNLEAAVGLMFFAVGMLDLVRFVTYANTQAGFRAGLLFACSAFSDSTGLFVAVVGAVAALLLVQSRTAARAANAVVVVFPTAAILAVLAVLSVAFGSSGLAMVRGDLSWSTARADEFVAFLASPAGLLFLAPTAVVVLTAIALGYAGVGLVSVLLTAMTSLAFVIGLTPQGTAGNNFVLQLLLAVAIVPTATARRHTLVTIATAVVLYAAGFAAALHRPAIVAWLGQLTGGMS